MRSISNAIINFFELIEAEGRSFRKSSISLVENMLVVFFAMALMFVGIIVALFSLNIWLSWHIGRAGSAAVIASLFLVLGGYLYVKAHSFAYQGVLLFEKARPDAASESKQKKESGADAR